MPAIGVVAQATLDLLDEGLGNRPMWGIGGKCGRCPYRIEHL
jgi:hypothetical protein